MLNTLPNTQPAAVDRIFTELAPLNSTPESVRFAEALAALKAIDEQLAHVFEETGAAREYYATVAAYTLGYADGQDAIDAVGAVATPIQG